jgi:hypothetical protein
MKRLLLVVATIGCNSVLGIPERELAVDEDTSIAADSTSEIAIDTGAPMETSVTETDPGDTSMFDSSSIDSTIDSTIEDTLDAADTTTPDTTMADTFKPDTTTADTTMADTTMPDTTVADTAMADTAMADTAMADTAMDSGDSGSCGVAGKPCCGAVPASCDKGAVCQQATDVCAASALACVRSTDCPGSACGGPTTCGGDVCFACTPVFGSKTFGTACTSGGDCASGVCDTFRGVCSAACSNGITKDADCAGLGTNVICSELNWTVSSATGKLGMCAQGCGRDADCGLGKTCRLASNFDADRLDLTCSKPGTAAYGAACTGGCIGGACLTFGSTTQCTPVCVSDADCAAMASWKSCKAVGFNRPVSMAIQAVKVCGP